MGEPGFWDDASRAAEISAEHAGARSRLGEYEGLRGDLEALTELVELTREAAEEPDPDFIAELDEGLRRADAPARPPGGGAPVLGPARRRRRRGLDQRRRGRHRRPGLGRDAPAHVPALGGAAGPAHRPQGGPGGDRGRHQVGHLHGPRAQRVRAAVGRERRAPARAPVAVRLGEPAADVLRRGGGRPAGERGGRRGDPRQGSEDRHLPRERRRRAAREQDRLGRPDHPPAQQDRGPVPERAIPDAEPRHGDGAAARPPGPEGAGPARGRGRQEPRREPEHRLREPDPVLRGAPLHDGQGPSYRARDGKRAGRARRGPRRVHPGGAGTARARRSRGLAGLREPGGED